MLKTRKQASQEMILFFHSQIVKHSLFCQNVMNVEKAYQVVKKFDETRS